jgi:hypothetical protein
MEFRVSPDKASSQRHDKRIRLFLWSAVLLLVGITIFGIVGVRSIGQTAETTLVVAAGCIVICVVVAAYILGAQEGFEKAKQNTVFLLSDDDLVRQHTGWPDVRIGLSEVKSLCERPGWLVIESAEPRRRIAIPAGVERFEFLRSELIKHGLLIKPPRRSPFLALLLGLPTVTSFFCWALIFWSKQPWLVKTAVCVALALLAWGSFSVSRLRIGSPKRYLLWAMLGISWVAALWIIYFRLARL